jgi:hypothetical protein
MKKLLFAMAIGAALAWAFDPELGSRRRDSVRRKLEARRTPRPDAAPSPVIPSAVPSPNSIHSGAGEPVTSIR